MDDPPALIRDYKPDAVLNVGAAFTRIRRLRMPAWHARWTTSMARELRTGRYRRPRRGVQFGEKPARRALLRTSRLVPGSGHIRNAFYRCRHHGASGSGFDPGVTSVFTAYALEALF